MGFTIWSSGQSRVSVVRFLCDVRTCHHATAGLIQVVRLFRRVYCDSWKLFDFVRLGKIHIGRSLHDRLSCLPQRATRFWLQLFFKAFMDATNRGLGLDAFIFFFVVVFFTLPDRASTIPSNIRGCQSGTYVVCWTGKYPEQRNIYEAPTRA